MVVVQQERDLFYPCSLEKFFIITKINLDVLEEMQLIATLPHAIIFVAENVTKNEIKKIKSLRTHCSEVSLPIIVLVRKGSTELQIDCLNAGAHAVHQYNVNAKVLKAQINSLSNGRESAYSSLIDLAEKKGQVDLLHNKFLKRVMDVLDQNYDISTFNTGEFVKQMQVSRTTLCLKIKHLTGKSISELVSDYRLQKAATLLKAGVLNVSEAAFEVGFSNPQYMSKRFKQKYGLTPNEYRKKRIGMY